MISPKMLALLAFLTALIVLLFTPRLAGAASPSRPLMMADPFQGKWKVSIEPDEEARHAGQKPIDDTLIFDGGTFLAESFKPRGFAPCSYEEDTRRFGPATFTAEPV